MISTVVTFLTLAMDAFLAAYGDENLNLFADPPANDAPANPAMPVPEAYVPEPPWRKIRRAQEVLHSTHISILTALYQMFLFHSILISFPGSTGCT